jgi:hypothetical protein
MKISKKRLKQIIKEEIDQAENEQGSEERDVKAKGQFSAKLLQLSKEIRSAQGLDANEMTEILGILLNLIQFASGKSGTALLKQLSALLSKRTGIEQ